MKRSDRSAALLDQLQGDRAQPAVALEFASLCRKQNRISSGTKALEKAAGALSPPLAWEIELALGRLYLWSGNGERAAAHLEAAVAANRDDAQLLSDLGAARRFAGDLVGAIDALSRANRLDPANPDIMLRLARAHLVADAPKTASAILTEACAIAPGDPRLWLDLARTEAKLGRDEEAVSAWHRAIRLEPTATRGLNQLAAFQKRKSLWADLAATARQWRTAEPESARPIELLAEAQRNLGDDRSAIASWRAALAIDEGRLPSLLGLMKSARKVGDHDQIEAAAEAILRVAQPTRRQTGRSPRTPGNRSLTLQKAQFAATLELAKLARGRGQPEAAVGLFERAVALSPKPHYGALFGLASGLLKTTRYREAEEIFRQAMATGGAMLPAELGLLSALAQSGKVDEAMARARSIAGRHSRNQDAILACGRALSQMGRLGDAIDLIQRSVPAHKRRIDLGLTLARYLRTAGRYTEAHRTCTDLQAAGHDGSADLFAELGSIDLERHRLQDALANFARAIAIDEGCRGAVHGMASALARQGNFAIAKSILEQHASQRPDDAAPLIELGQIANQLRRFSEGEAIFRELLDRWPGNNQAVAGRAASLQGLGRYDEAEGILLERRTGGVSSPEIEAALAELASRRGNLEEARAAWLSVTEQWPNDTRWKLRLADADVKRGRRDLAEQVYLDATAKFPGDLRILKPLALFYFLNADYEKSRRILEEVSRGGDFTDNDRLISALLAVELGETETAQQRLDQLDQIKPDSVIIGRLVLAKRNGDVEAFHRWLNALMDKERWPVRSTPDTGRRFFQNLTTAQTGTATASNRRDEAAAVKVSVIMTAFNASETIGYAVDSILNQDHRNLELIIIDDCSSDRTMAVARDYEARDGRIKVVAREENAGTYVCRNVAMGLTTGSFITFQDADDWSHPQRLSVQLRDLLDTGARMNLAKCLRIDEAGNVDIRYAWSYPIYGLGPVTCMFRRSLIDEIGYFDSVRAAGDTEYLERIQALFGDDALSVIGEPLLLALNQSRSLVNSSVWGRDYLARSPTMFAYQAAFRRWHAELRARQGDGFMAFPLQQRPFAIPEANVGGVSGRG